MTGAGILGNDFVVVRRQSSAESGDIVVALVDDEATVKRLYRRGARIELRPENPSFDVIVPHQGELRLLGKVIEVHRYLDAQPPLSAGPH
jgi:repressor LexA